MKIIFAGTPEFSLPALDALLKSEHQIVAVYTKADKPAGRGLKLTASPVKQAALAAGLKVLQPKTLRDQAVQDERRALGADIFVDVACGFLLPPEVLTMPPLGCINIHPSLLPRWRGAAPIERTILAGDKITGVTIMQMDEGFDTGDIILQQEVILEDKHLNAQELSAHLADIGARLLVFTLAQIANNEIAPSKQDATHAIYAEKITKQEAKIDWHKSSSEIDRMILAFNPRPGAYTNSAKYATIKIWAAAILEENTNAEAGTVINLTKNGIDVACGDEKVIRLLELQFPGGKKLSAREVINARRIAVGDILV